MQEVYRIISNMIDSHAHVISEQFDSDRENVIATISAQGLRVWIEVGTTLDESKKAVAFAEKHTNIFSSVGVHPEDILRIKEEDWLSLESLANHPKTCAIGEVGFDTYREGKIAEQEPVLRRFITLAQKVNKPIIFHVRSRSAGKTPGVEEVDSHTELIRVLTSYPLSELPHGVIHTFSGTLAQAQEYIALGMMISFSGVITFKNAGALPEIVKTIPLDSILVETDCPYLTPEPHRGMRNEPAYVRHVIQKIAELREVSFQEIELATENNTKKLFALDY